MFVCEIKVLSRIHCDLIKKGCAFNLKNKDLTFWVIVGCCKVEQQTHSHQFETPVQHLERFILKPLPCIFICLD